MYLRAADHGVAFQTNGDDYGRMFGLIPWIARWFPNQSGYKACREHAMGLYDFVQVSSGMVFIKQLFDFCKLFRILLCDNGKHTIVISSVIFLIFILNKFWKLRAMLALIVEMNSFFFILFVKYIFNYSGSINIGMCGFYNAYIWINFYSNYIITTAFNYATRIAGENVQRN